MLLLRTAGVTVKNQPWDCPALHPDPPPGQGVPADEAQSYLRSCLTLRIPDLERANWPHLFPVGSNSRPLLLGPRWAGLGAPEAHVAAPRPWRLGRGGGGAECPLPGWF